MSGRRLQITLQPDVLRWARERAKLQPEELAKKMGVKRHERVLEWERDGVISVAQIDKLAKCTYTPLGFLYSKEPPDDRLPIADFRPREGAPPPSPDLLDTVYLMQRRQAWMRDELIKDGVEPLGFVGAYGLDSHPQNVASAMREALQLTHGWADTQSTWRDALRLIQDRLDATGVLVCFNSVVGNNSHRKLDPKEFQGFALADEYAPLIFVNNADFRAAQIFTLAHELAHLFIAKTGVSTLEALQPSPDDTEKFCDKAAAEFLVPAEELRAFWSRSGTNNPLQAVATKFKVSSIVAARRALDLKLISTDTFFNFYRANAKEWDGNQPREDDGGNFWNTQKWRIGPRFATAIVRAVKEERTLYREAYNLTGLWGDTFENIPGKMGMVL